jgi:hypothetical protein
VATDSAFTSFVAGYNNYDAGGNILKMVTGLLNGISYFYRVRAYNSVGTSISSDKITTTTLSLPYSDWFLPSKDEFNAIQSVLYFGTPILPLSGEYWTSSENNSTTAWRFYYPMASTSVADKPNLKKSIPCRKLTTTFIFNIGDFVQGGWVFDILDLGGGNFTYFIASTLELVATEWSNITNLAVGTTGTAVGNGLANTNAIIGQVGHTTSAALLCKNLIV